MAELKIEEFIKILDGFEAEAKLMDSTLTEQERSRYRQTRWEHLFYRYRPPLKKYKK